MFKSGGCWEQGKPGASFAIGDGNVTGPNAETPHAGTRLSLDPQPPIPASTSSTTQVVALQDVSLTHNDRYICG
jgi:hypothetical protein